MRELTHSVAVNAPATAVLDAFFQMDALAAWWGASRSLCMPRVLGSYVIEWEAAGARDDLLGPLGGAFRGTVIDFVSGREFFVADAYWLPAEGDPIGPMAFEVTCTATAAATTVTVRQSGWDNSPRWTRYYEVLASTLPSALGKLKEYVEAKEGEASEAAEDADQSRPSTKLGAP